MDKWMDGRMDGWMGAWMGAHESRLSVHSCVPLDDAEPK